MAESNTPTPGSLDQHLSRISETMRTIQRNVGYTGVFEALLGKGDGTGTILAPVGTFPIRQLASAFCFD